MLRLVTGRPVLLGTHVEKNTGRLLAYIFSQLCESVIIETRYVGEFKHNHCSYISVARPAITHGDRSTSYPGRPASEKSFGLTFSLMQCSLGNSTNKHVFG